MSYDKNMIQARVLLSLLNLLRKRDKMISKPYILYLFSDLFNKFNDTGALILDPLYLFFIDRLWSGEGRYQLCYSQHP